MSTQEYNFIILILFKHSVVALTLASYFFMYFFCNTAILLENVTLKNMLIIKTPIPAKKVNLR